MASSLTPWMLGVMGISRAIGSIFCFQTRPNGPCQRAQSCSTTPIPRRRGLSVYRARARRSATFAVVRAGDASILTLVASASCARPGAPPAKASCTNASPSTPAASAPGAVSVSSARRRSAPRRASNSTSAKTSASQAGPKSQNRGAITAKISASGAPMAASPMARAVG